jgi:hypothetical protein
VDGWILDVGIEDDGLGLGFLFPWGWRILVNFETLGRHMKVSHQIFLAHQKFSTSLTYVGINI